MNATVTSEDKIDYLLIESTGILKTKEDLFEHSRMIYNEIKKYNFKKILVNEPGIQFPPGFFQYCDLVMLYINAFPREIRFLKIAIVISNDYKDLADFWETVCVNHGLNYFSFTTFQDGLDWLLA